MRSLPLCPLCVQCIPSLFVRISPCMVEGTNLAPCIENFSSNTAPSCPTSPCGHPPDMACDSYPIPYRYYLIPALGPCLNLGDLYLLPLPYFTPSNHAKFPDHSASLLANCI
ncbi:hypothetical protein Salat_2042900 [Sesamum alatum]|uniref:Uncharacterized protein n=1 Tax=Sesamum alatum TaxID=300844 RepID=A0AAE1XZP1_9LAMI|nr:hypothetical protein Salat_2042900 [Sesamum alatum]